MSTAVFTTEMHMQYDNTKLSQLRTRINDLSKTALSLRLESTEFEFDDLNSKIGLAMQAFAYHEHDIIASHESTNFLISELNNYKKDNESIKKSLAAIQLKYQLSLKSASEHDNTCALLSNKNRQLEESLRFEQNVHSKLEAKLIQMQQSFVTQRKQIGQAHKLTDSNLKQLQSWLKLQKLKNSQLELKHLEVKDELTQTQSKLNDSQSMNKFLKEYETKFEELVQKHEKKVRDFNDLELSTVQMKSTVEEQKSIITDLNSKIKNFKSEHEQLNCEKIELSSSVQALTRKLTSCKELNEAIHQELFQEKDISTKIENKFQNCQKMIEEKEQIVKELTRKQNNMEMEHKTKIQIIEDQSATQMQQMQSSLSNEIHNLQRKNETLSEEVKTVRFEKDREHSEFIKTVELLENERETAQRISRSEIHFESKCQDLEQSVERLTEQLNKLSCTTKDLQSEITQNMDTIDTKDRVLSLRKTENDDLRQQLNEMITLISSKDAKLFELQQINDKLVKSKNILVQLKATQKLMKNQNLQLKEKLNNEKDKNTAISNKLLKQKASLQTLLSKDERELNQMTNLLTKAQKEILKENQVNQKLKNLLHEKENHHMNEKHHLQSIIAKLKQDYEFETKSNSNNIEVVENKTKSLVSKNKRLSIEVEKRDRLVSKLSMEISRLKATMTVKSLNVPVYKLNLDFDNTKANESPFDSKLLQSRHFVLDSNATNTSTELMHEINVLHGMLEDNDRRNQE